MRIPRFSLRSCLFAVGLVAVDLAVLRGWVLAARRGGVTHADLLGLSILPMLNVLLVMAAVRRRDVSRRSPFARGFVVFGLAGLLIHAACHVFWKSTIAPFYNAPFLPWLEFCQAHLPYSFAPLRDGKSYFRYYPALGIVYGSPQFIAAFLGGILSALVARGRRIAGPTPNLAPRWSRPGGGTGAEEIVA